MFSTSVAIVVSCVFGIFTTKNFNCRKRATLVLIFFVLAYIVSIKLRKIKIILLLSPAFSIRYRGIGLFKTNPCFLSRHEVFFSKNAHVQDYPKNPSSSTPKFPFVSCGAANVNANYVSAWYLRYLSTGNGTALQSSSGPGGSASPSSAVGRTLEVFLLDREENV